MSVHVGISGRNAYELYVSVAALGGIGSREFKHLIIHVNSDAFPPRPYARDHLLILNQERSHPVYPRH